MKNPSAQSIMRIIMLARTMPVLAGGVVGDGTPQSCTCDALAQAVKRKRHLISLLVVLFGSLLIAGLMLVAASGVPSVKAVAMHSVLVFDSDQPSPTAHAAAYTVTLGRPRILLTPTIKARLQAKVSANDTTWIALRERADLLATFSILPYKWITRTAEPPNTIFYDYQGEGWWGATMPLALAYQMTGDAKYCNKLSQLADEMWRAQFDPDNNPPNGIPPLQPDNYYPTRNLGPVLGIIFDWCYDRLGITRTNQITTLMNIYFDDIRANAYQRNENADGNFFGGHLFAAAFMGYASFGDNPRAQTMIDYARIRFDGTPSARLEPSDIPNSYFAQVFDGGYKPLVALGFNGPDVSGAPFKSGFDFQGWSYGSEEYNRIIDYLLAVQSATGEDLFTPHRSWFGQILRALKHALLPNRFEIDPSGDWGGDYGAVIRRSLPYRLAFVLSGTADGPGAQSFAYSEIAATSPFPAEIPESIYQSVMQPNEWEAFYFGDNARPAAALNLPAYYTGFGPAYPQGVYSATNGAMPYFIMRRDWSASATWASINMGAAFYDDHQHANAGNLMIKRGDDWLLIDAANWKGSTGLHGIYGSSTEQDSASAANTFFFHDYGDFQGTTDIRFIGGQNLWGLDQVVADEQNDAYTYIRSDLSTAFNNGADPALQVDRKLNYFYRNYVYLRANDLFVVYDQINTLTATNPITPYLRHLRWHFPITPTLSGKTISVQQGASRLYLDTLIPANAQLTVVDEANNPDSALVAFSCDCNSNTLRVEVRDPANQQSIPFLSVIQVGPTTTLPMSSTNLVSVDGRMRGAQIVQPTGATNVVLFNNQDGQVPTAITSTSYTFTGAPSALHTLCGLVPSARYRVTNSGSTISVVQDNAGSLSASAAGVLQFTLAPPPQPTYLPLIVR